MARRDTIREEYRYGSVIVDGIGAAGELVTAKTPPRHSMFQYGMQWDEISYTDRVVMVVVIVVVEVPE